VTFIFTNYELCDLLRATISVHIPSIKRHDLYHSKGKGKFRPIKGHESPEGEYKYSSTLSLTPALDGVGGHRHAPDALPPGKTQFTLYRRLGVYHGQSELVRKISPPPGFDPRTIQPVASRYTDWAIPAQNLYHSTLYEV
jgi:hypothetical protein